MIRFNSQFGEDKWLIEKIFNLKLSTGMGIWENGGFYVDIGCAHPVKESNTSFLRDLGWKGLCVDPNPHWNEYWEDVDAEYENLAISSDASEVKMIVPYLISDPSQLLPQCTTKVSDDAVIANECGEVVAKACTLKELVNKYSIESIDILDIDVEGFELDVWNSFSSISEKGRGIKLRN